MVYHTMENVYGLISMYLSWVDIGLFMTLQRGGSDLFAELFCVRKQTEARKVNSSFHSA